MTISLRQRSPLGAPFRSPLGVLGPGTAGPPVEILLEVTGRALNAQAFDAIPGDWNVGDGDPDPLTCSISAQFISGAGFRYTQFRVTGMLNPPTTAAERPDSQELWDYTFIGQTSGIRFRPSVDVGPFVCWNGRTNTGDGIASVVGFTGTIPQPTISMDIRVDYFVADTGSNHECTIYTAVGAAGHPGWTVGEDLIGYPDALVPPP